MSKDAEPKPSIGRTVHYAAHTANGVACVPALINQVAEDGTVGLCVLDPRGVQQRNGCEQDELPPTGKIASGERAEHRGDTWHWPEAG
jgi:hypothetical protein